MEALIKKEIIYFLNTEPAEVIQKFPCEGTSAIIDFTNSVQLNLGSGIAFKQYKSNEPSKAWNQLKRWISSQSFDQIIVVGGLDCFPTDMVYDWLFDHKSKKGFPKLIFSGEKIISPMDKLANLVIE